MERVTLRDLIGQLDSMEEEALQEQALLWGSPGRVADITTNPAFIEMARVLQEQPLLVVPVLKWLRLKRAEMARAQLGVLYTAEELEQMYAEARAK